MLREGRERRGREHRPGTQEAICRQNPVSDSVPPTSSSLLSTTPHSFWVALSKLLNLSGTSTLTTRWKSADLPGREWCGWVGGPVRRLGKRGSD